MHRTISIRRSLFTSIGHLRARLCVGLLGLVALSGCSDAPGEPWNSPYPGDADQAQRMVLYSSFTERPKHLDPARSYSSDEYRFIGQIYEPPVQYHFLKRPYELVPLTAKSLPTEHFFDANGDALPADVDPAKIAFTEYRVSLQPGIRYQPHPALARDEQGAFRYHALSESALDDLHNIGDFAHTGTRELQAGDYVHQIKRLADPKVHSPLYSLMAQYIVGLEALHDQIVADRKAGKKKALSEYPLEGVVASDALNYSIRIKGRYPQFIFWMAMPFFSPMPPEADAFYAQPGLAERNITLDWFPIGTGPYYLAENNPNRRMVLERNPHFRGEPYPAQGDANPALLADAGKPMPFIDRAVYSLEKETIPRWTKFLQGYYDASGISSDSFDQAVNTGADGALGLTDEMRERDIALVTSVATSINYFGFNMLDPVVGGQRDGDPEAARKLRQAIAIGLDYGELIEIFANGRGVEAQGVLPPGIFGYREGAAGINPQAFEWRDGRPVRKPIEAARKLIAEAGYPDGVDPKTGKPLILYYDVIGGAGPEQKARLDWYRKQFKRMGLELVVRNTDYNRFREKMRNGSAQMFTWGWNADYPDPENFFFLLHSKQGKVAFKGENAANFSNPEYDALFDRMKNMTNGPERQAIIDRMLELLRVEAPWAGGYYPKDFTLHHDWLKNVKPNLMAHNTLKYQRIDTQARAAKRAEWNSPAAWPIVLFLLVVAALVWLMIHTWKAREAMPLRPASSADNEEAMP